MKADKQLEWQTKPDGFFGGDYHAHEAEGYIIHPYKMGRMTWRLEGNGMDVIRDDVTDLQARAQEHYNRGRRLKVWEDYMLSHDPPT
jgi:hypothetical protein